MIVTMSKARQILERKEVKLIETVRTHGGLRFNIVATINKKGEIDARGNTRRPKVLRVNSDGFKR